MSTNPTPPIFSSLVAEIYDLDAQIDYLKSQKAARVSKIIELGEGRYCDDSDTPRTVLVVPMGKASISYNLYSDSALKAFLAERQKKQATPKLKAEFMALQETKAKILAGEDFGKLFDKVTLFSAAKGFVDLVPKLLTTAAGKASAKSERLLALCEVVKAGNPPYIKLPEKPKPTAASGSEEDEE